MSAAPESALDLADDRRRALALTPVSRETAERLDRYVALLLATQAHTNLISAASVAQIWTRHISDSLQLLDLAPEAKTWLDIGAGAGFPGMVIACVLVDRPGAAVHLVESHGKKAAFLHQVVEGLGLPAVVHRQRIEDFAADVLPDVITARAVAPLGKLLGYVAPLLKSGAKALLPKGQDVEVELTEAAKYWKIDAELVPSRTNAASRIVVVRSARRQSGKR